MAKVFSYVRFSSKPQEQGDSIRRQTAMGEAWLRRHPEHALDRTLNMHDKGVRAFNGANLDPSKGALGRFIALAKQPDNPIERGSILMLENLDRFSRLPPRKAYAVFCELVEAGVRVLTLDPEQLFDESNIDDMASTLTVIIKMQLNFEESRKKAARQVANWTAKHQRAAATGARMTRRCPSWLYWDEQRGKWAIKPGAKETMRYIFTRACEGVGKQRMLAELNAKHKTWGASPNWSGSVLSSILKDRMVLGELQPRRKSAKPGAPISDYYPRMVDDELFYRARAAIDKRRTARGRNTQFVNLLVGLVRFPDGRPGQVQTATWTNGTGKHIGRRLVSAGHRERAEGACPLSVEYFKVERYIMAALFQLTAKDLFPAPTRVSKGVRDLERELAGMEARLTELEKALTDSDQPVASLGKAITDLTARRDAARRRLDDARGQRATTASNPAKGIQDVLRLIDSQPEADQHNLRLKLRGLIADIVERIDLEPKKIGRSVDTVITVTLRHWPDPRRIRINTAEIAPEDLPAAYARARQDLPDIERKARARGGIKAHPVYLEVVADSLKGARADVVEIGYDETRIHYTGEAKDGTVKKPPRPRRAK